MHKQTSRDSEGVRKGGWEKRIEHIDYCRKLRFVDTV